MYGKLQQPDGYLSSWYQRMQPGKRWTNLRDCHELYCAGHLIEGAVAYLPATGKRKLLDVMCRYVGPHHLGVRAGARQEAGLLRSRGDRTRAGQARPYHRQTRLYGPCKAFIDRRGQQPHYFDEEAKARGDDPEKFHFKTHEYNQSHQPVREQDKVSATPCAPCIFIPAWPTSRPNMATTACAPHWTGSGTTCTRSGSTSPAA